MQQTCMLGWNKKYSNNSGALHTTWRIAVLSWGAAHTVGWCDRKFSGLWNHDFPKPRYTLKPETGPWLGLTEWLVPSPRARLPRWFVGKRNLHLSVPIFNVGGPSRVKMSCLFAGPQCFTAELNLRSRTQVKPQTGTIFPSNTSNRHKQCIRCEIQYCLMMRNELIIKCYLSSWWCSQPRGCCRLTRIISRT